MTALVQAEQDGDKLSENELLAMAFLLLVAGFETTVHLIGGGILALLEDSRAKGATPADWSLLPSAVEELLRFVSPVQISEAALRQPGRGVPRPVASTGRHHRRIAGVSQQPTRPASTTRSGWTSLAAPNPHVAFGTGMHFCLGAQLARIEAQVAIEKVFSRFPNLSLAVPSDALRYTGQINLRALTALPVRLT